MKTIKKYTLEQFEKKYSGKRHISCGITFDDDTKETIMNQSCSVIVSYIKSKNKLVKYIATV